MGHIIGSIKDLKDSVAQKPNTEQIEQMCDVSLEKIKHIIDKVCTMLADTCKPIQKDTSTILSTINKLEDMLTRIVNTDIENVVNRALEKFKDSAIMHQKIDANEMKAIVNDSTNGTMNDIIIRPNLGRQYAKDTVDRAMKKFASILEDQQETYKHRNTEKIKFSFPDIVQQKICRDNNFLTVWGRNSTNHSNPS